MLNRRRTYFSADIGRTMRRPVRTLIWMIGSLTVVAAIVGLFFAPLQQAFLANIVFNSMILAVFVLGVMINLRQVISLGPEVTWIEAFKRDRPADRQPILLASMAKMLTGRRSERFSLSTLSLRTLLDGIRARLDESRDLSRYLIGLLVFLGLLGTFWGLLATLGSVSNVIDSLSADSGDIGTVFDDLKNGLKQPLSGMGIAFSSSLFGLAGSLILGFLDLQAGHAQNRFYNELEEWLSGLTRLSSGSLGGDDDAPVPQYTQSLLEQTAENLDRLQQLLTRQQERSHPGAALYAISQQLDTISGHLAHEQQLLSGLVNCQLEMLPLVKSLAATAATGRGLDDATRDHIRSLDGRLTQLADELAAGRQQLSDEMRHEIRLLTRTVGRMPGLATPLNQS